MTDYGRCQDLTSLVINTTSFLPEFPFDKIGSLLLEIQTIRDDFSRDLAVNFIAGNFSKNKHLCTKILSGKSDAEIVAIMDELEASIREEIEARNSNRFQ